MKSTLFESDKPVIELRGVELSEFKAIAPKEMSEQMRNCEVLYGYITETGGRDWYTQPRK